MKADKEKLNKEVKNKGIKMIISFWFVSK